MNYPPIYGTFFIFCIKKVQFFNMFLFRVFQQVEPNAFNLNNESIFIDHYFEVFCLSNSLSYAVFLFVLCPLRTILWYNGVVQNGSLVTVGPRRYTIKSTVAATWTDKIKHAV